MTSNTIKSYDTPDRVKEYDNDMEIMHPNRHKMVNIALEILPIEKKSVFTAIELGSGTGYFTKKFLSYFPNSNIIAVDGAEFMLELAKERLGNLTQRIEFITGDFRMLKNIIPGNTSIRVTFSSYALHHLNKTEKLNTLKAVKDILAPGGWFINADLSKPANPEVEKRIRNIRIDGIIKRSSGSDERFLDYNTTSKFITDMEANENDQPLTITEDLQILSEAGLKNTSIFWMEYREVVYGGEN